MGFDFVVVCGCGWRGKCNVTRRGLKHRGSVVFARWYLGKQLSDHVYGRNTEKRCKRFKPHAKGQKCLC